MAKTSWLAYLQANTLHPYEGWRLRYPGEVAVLNEEPRMVDARTNTWEKAEQARDALWRRWIDYQREEGVRQVGVMSLNLQNRLGLDTFYDPRWGTSVDPREPENR